jgi:hypothetical protein
VTTAYSSHDPDNNRLTTEHAECGDFLAWLRPAHGSLWCKVGEFSQNCRRICKRTHNIGRFQRR